MKFQEIIDGLSAQLMTKMVALANEEHSPSHGVDCSDDKIKTLRTKVARLRAIREELEILAAQPDYASGA